MSGKPLGNLSFYGGTKMRYKAQIFKVLARAEIEIEAMDDEEILDILEEMNKTNQFDFQTCEGEPVHYSFVRDDDDLEGALYEIGCE